jgi:hypothetical protein
MTSMRSLGGLVETTTNVAREARDQVGHGRLQRVMALMAAFAAIVSGFEAWTQHTRGAFTNRWMWTPIALTPPVAMAAGAAMVSRRAARTLLPLASLGYLADGIVGFALHIRGVRRLPGGYRLGTYNVTMGPPLFAPLLLTSAGILGVLAAFLRPEELRLGGRRG